LPVVESSYDIGARSSVGAVGIWQFMPGTARSYMRVDGNIDERRDPLEATRAAASYLNQAYDLLGSWPLAITSYNLGQAGMARAAAEAGSNNLVDIIQRYNHPYFGFAPKQFYAEFLAAVEIGKNFSRYFPELQQDAPQTIKEIALENNTMVQNAIEASGMSRDDFLEWNPGIALHAQVLPAGYRVKLPEGRTMEPLVNIAQVNYFAPAIGRGQRARSGGPGQSQVIHHRVRQGETLSQIASRYGANIRQILQANGLRHANLVRVGTTLRIPRI
jgi:membrane-bound lytic murein transglycosylase D